MELAHINHYYCKSREEYLEKCSRGLADQTRVRDDIFSLLDKNDVIDESTLKYCGCIKWCPGPESNRYGLYNRKILSLVRLPVPPPGLLVGDSPEIRTPDPVIKSQVLYQLS